MRLLNSRSLEMSEFQHTDIPPYAILSHTWGEKEATLQDMQRFDTQNNAGFTKILNCCEQAKLDGFEWVWIDTCCIDKTSSTELSEAINSMYAWYQDSEVCYAFLEDVPALDPFFPEVAFERARWFKRGWCLQELIAPSKIEFYAADWTEIGTKWSLHSQIEKTTGIPVAFLLGKSDLADYTIAQKMSWASKRRTTRQEDEAYCLLGIFGVYMPLLYGEGRRAFRRLQEEIMKQTEDYSFLLWTEPNTRYQPGVLAESPTSFPKAGPYVSSGKRCNYRSIKSILLDRAASKDLSWDYTRWNPPQMTTRGLRLHTFVRKVQPTQNSTSLLLWTGCMYAQAYMCIKLHQNEQSGFLKYGRSTNDRIVLIGSKEFKSFEFSELYLNTNTRRTDFGVMQPSERPDLEMILSTKCEENVFFVEALPPITIYKTGSCTQGRRLYCLNLNVSTRQTLSLKFIACQARSGITTGQFTVNFGRQWARAPPWCSLEVDSDTNSTSSSDARTQIKICEDYGTTAHSSDDEYETASSSPSNASTQIEIREDDSTETHSSENESETGSSSPSNASTQAEGCEDDDIEIHESETEDETGPSDRAIGQLPNGRMVYVAIKGTNDPPGLSPSTPGYFGDWKQRKPAFYNLQVTLLAGGAGIKSMTHP